MELYKLMQRTGKRLNEIIRNILQTYDRYNHREDINESLTNNGMSLVLYFDCDNSYLKYGDTDEHLWRNIGKELLVWNDYINGVYFIYLEGKLHLFSDSEIIDFSNWEFNSIFEEEIHGWFEEHGYTKLDSSLNRFKKYQKGYLEVWCVKSQEFLIIKENIRGNMRIYRKIHTDEM